MEPAPKCRAVTELLKNLGIFTLLLAGCLVLAMVAAGCTGGKAPQQTPVPVTTAPQAPLASAPPAPATTQPSAPPAVATTPMPATTAPAAYPGVQQIAGILRVTGSTTVLPIAQAEADAYQDLNKQANIQVTGGGSAVGVQAIGDKTTDIGMSSRDISSDEMKKYPDLVPTDIATDAIVLIVNPANPVSSITLDQARGIYNGTYQGWNSDNIGGTATYIVTIGRDAASGTRVYFNDAVMHGEKYRSDMREMNSNGGVKQAVAETPGAIGYVGLGFIDSTVKPLAVFSKGQPVTPSIATVLAHQYPISRPLYMITNGQPTGLAKDYIDFILSPAGQKIVADQGFVPLQH